MSVRDRGVQEEAEKRLFLVEQHCIGLEHGHKGHQDQLDRYSLQLAKIDAHIEGGVRLQNLEKRMKDDNIQTQKLQNDIF